MEAEAIKSVVDVLGGLAGVASVVIAWFLFRISLQQHRDSWFRAFNELHAAFWDRSAGFHLARSWIADDNQYLEIDGILARRFSGRDQLQAKEYAKLEELDRFFNFLLRAHAVAERQSSPLWASVWRRFRSGWLKIRRKNVNSARSRPLWEKLYFQYWLDEIITARRHRLWLYYQDFYLKKEANLPFTFARDELDEFTEQAEDLRHEIG